MTDFLNTTEAGRIVRRTERTIIRWLVLKKIEGFKLEGRWMVSRESLLILVKSCQNR
jgi:hypothetical protein